MNSLLKKWVLVKQSLRRKLRLIAISNSIGKVDLILLKYKLMVVEETPEEEKYRKLQNTTDWIKNSSTEEFVSTMPEPLEKMVQNSQNHPSLGDVIKAMNYIFSQ